MVFEELEVDLHAEVVVIEVAAAAVVMVVEATMEEGAVMEHHEEVDFEEDFEAERADTHHIEVPGE